MSLLHQRFEARAVHPDYGNEVLVGEISLSIHCLRFEAAEIAFEIPVERLVANVFEGDEERLHFRDTEQPELEVFTDDFSLLDCTLIPALVQARQRLEERLSRRDSRSRLKLVGYAALVCVLAIWLGGILMGFAVKSLARRVPAEWDKKFGASVLESVQEEVTFSKDSNAVARLVRLAEPLMKVLPPEPNGYRFHIAEDEDANAFALPGGHIVVNTGLLRLADRPEQVLGVIAHEVAHVSERHAYRSQISTSGPIMVFGVFLGGSGPMGLISAGTSVVAGAGFSQEYETEADNVGWKYLVAANINPHGMIEMFQKFKEGEGDGFGLPNALSTHPTFDRRIARLESKWKKLKFKGGFITLNQEPVLRS